MKRFFVVSSFLLTFGGLLLLADPPAKDAAESSDSSAVEDDGAFFIEKEGRELREQQREIHDELMLAKVSYLSSNPGNYRKALDEWKESNREVIQWLEETRAKQGSLDDEEIVEEHGRIDFTPRGASIEEAQDLRDTEARIEVLIKGSSVNGSKDNQRNQRLRQIIAEKKRLQIIRDQIRVREDRSIENRKARGYREEDLSSEPELAEIKTMSESGSQTNEDFRRIRELLKERIRRLSEKYNSNLEDGLETEDPTTK